MRKQNKQKNIFFVTYCCKVYVIQKWARGHPRRHGRSKFPDTFLFFFLVGDVTTCKRMWEPFMSDEYGRGRVWRRVRSCLTVVSQSTMCPSPSMLKCYPPTYPTLPTQPADLPRGGNWLDAQTGQNPRFNCKMSRGVGATEAHVRKNPGRKRDTRVGRLCY